MVSTWTWGRFRADDPLVRAHLICLFNAQVRKLKPAEVTGLTGHCRAMAKGWSVDPGVSQCMTCILLALSVYKF